MDLKLVIAGWVHVFKNGALRLDFETHKWFLGFRTWLEILWLSASR
jgi:hypothetical protein